jgi:tripartite-type tricarboxylate transporter receptor subunit TctC
LKGLAVSSEERLPEYADIPTFKESGFPDVVATIWFSISGPAGLPPPIVEKLNRGIVGAVQQPKVLERLRAEGSIIQPMTVEEFRRFIDAEIAHWTPVVENSGIVAK